MLFTDSYFTIERDGKGEFKDRGSKFFSFAFKVSSEEEVKHHLATLIKEHHNAAHHCYAVVIGPGKEIRKSHDDREPSNSAGKPILRAILSKDLTDTVVFVVRYFGGKLLGIPGLINAYEQSALAALDDAGTRNCIVTETYELMVPYEHENEAFRIIKLFGLKVLQHHHGDEIRIIFEVQRSKAGQVLDAVNEKHVLKIKYVQPQQTNSGH